MPFRTVDVILIAPELLALRNSPFLPQASLIAQLEKNLPAMQPLFDSWVGRSGEGIGYPLQYSWASIAAQMVKNSPAMWETWVRSLGWEYLLEKGKATHSRILDWRIPWTIVHGVAKSQTQLSDFCSHSYPTLSR